MMMMMESQHRKSQYFRKLLVSAIQHAQLAQAEVYTIWMLSTSTSNQPTRFWTHTRCHSIVIHSGVICLLALRQNYHLKQTFQTSQLSRVSSAYNSHVWLRWLYQNFYISGTLHVLAHQATTVHWTSTLIIIIIIIINTIITMTVT